MNDPLEEEYQDLLKYLSKGDTHPCDQIQGAHGEFGYALTNPIPGDRDSYCRKLRCPNGHPYWYHRAGNVGEGPDGHVIDKMELLCFAGESHIFLYFDMYHEGSSSLVPAKLRTGSNAGMGTIIGFVENFPEGLEEYDPRQDLR